MQKRNFNSDWIFEEGSRTALSVLLGGDNRRKIVQLPHDASIRLERDKDAVLESGNGYFKEINCCYTKKFFLDKKDQGNCVCMEFEGVYQNAFVYVNEAFVGKCPYGYSNFYLDITNFIDWEKENKINVIVKNKVSSGRWYTGTGIYRNVNLMIGDRLHFMPDQVCLKTIEMDQDLAVVEASSMIAYKGTGVRNVEYVVELADSRGVVVAENRMPVTVMEYTENRYKMKIYIPSPVPWDAETPYLYHYHAFLKEENHVVDEVSGTFGIRTLQLDPIRGLRVNGKPVKLRGGCIHHDNGIIGAAEFPHAAKCRIKAMKKAGYNAVRSSHYPMSRCLLDACDEIGMYVMDEFSDVWTSSKKDFDYGMHMSEWWEHDITNMVYKDYNHPSVIMYSIGNEISECGNKFDVQFGKRIADKIKSLDDSRYTTNSLNLVLCAVNNLEKMGQEEKGKSDTPFEINSFMNNMAEAMNELIRTDFVGKLIEEACSQVDIVGYNYATDRYEKDCQTYSNRIMVGSETYPEMLDANWELVEKYPNLLGDFSWTAWDYLGEAGIGQITYGKRSGKAYAAYPYKLAYCGDFNILGDRRPASYWREIIWGRRTKPYITVQPPKYFNLQKNKFAWAMTDYIHNWNWVGYEGKKVRVEVFADADEVELSVNDKMVERKTVGENKKAITEFETIYQPGTIKCYAIKNGKVIGEDSIVTPEDKICMKAAADVETVPADGSDIVYVDVWITDKEGNLNYADNLPAVKVRVEGPGEIIGYGSADPESEENYFDMEAKPFEGRLRAAVRGTGTAGDICLSFLLEDNEPVCIKVQAVE